MTAAQRTSVRSLQAVTLLSSPLSFCISGPIIVPQSYRELLARFASHHPRTCSSFHIRTFLALLSSQQSFNQPNLSLSDPVAMRASSLGPQLHDIMGLTLGQIPSTPVRSENALTMRETSSTLKNVIERRSERQVLRASLKHAHPGPRAA